MCEYGVQAIYIHAHVRFVKTGEKLKPKVTASVCVRVCVRGVRVYYVYKCIVGGCVAGKNAAHVHVLSELDIASLRVGVAGMKFSKQMWKAL